MKISGRIALLVVMFSILSYGVSGVASAQNIPAITVETNQSLYAQGNTVIISGNVRDFQVLATGDVTVVVLGPTSNIVFIAQITPDSLGDFSTSFPADGIYFKSGGKYTIEVRISGQIAATSFEYAGGTGTAPDPVDPTCTGDEILVDGKCMVPEPEEPTCVGDEILVDGKCMVPEPEEPKCGPGTVLEDGQCVPEEEEPNGCLIATATYGSELAPQVQFLRELRDNTILSTSSGASFMTGFNTLYYSFSPTIADWERESPVFKEIVKITITPLLTSLSILNYVDIDSEAEMLGYGIGIILLNVGMYFVAPALIIFKLKNRK